MADLKAVYDSMDDIPETIEFRDLFTEKGGKYELTGIGGVKTQADIDRLRASVEKERQEHKATKERYAVWADLDYDDVQAKLDKYPELEAAAAGKLDESAIEEMAQKRAEGTLRSKMAPLERDLKKTQTERDELVQRVEVLSAQALKREREDILRPLLVAAGVLPEHHEDVFLYAERHLEKGEDGTGFFAREGLDGITSGAPPKDWLAEMLERRPGWLPPSVGGGAKGSPGSGAPSGPNPWSAEGWNMTEQGRIFREKGAEYAERLAKAAGTKVGGARPRMRA